jgi:hypothetical protein
MNCKFTNDLSDGITQKPILISGKKSIHFSKTEYVLIEQGNNSIPYEIRYEYSCSPFKDALIENEILAVGFEEKFYLFDISKNKSILSLKVKGYFGHLYLHDDLFYVADAYGLYCVNKVGYILWYNSNIAIDGVIVNKFEGNKIYVQGEQNPPDNWEYFVLDLATGEKI